jgi:hypothetical protein
MFQAESSESGSDRVAPQREEAMLSNTRWVQHLARIAATCPPLSPAVLRSTTDRSIFATAAAQRVADRAH